MSDRPGGDGGDVLTDGGGTSDSGGTSDGGDLAAIDRSIRERFPGYVVAKKEVRDTIRSKLLWVLSVIFVVIFALPAFFGLYLDIGNLASEQGVTITTDSFFRIAGQFGSALVPIIAIVVGYGAVVGERESGSLKVLLSLPFTRRDVVLGKVLGRGAVLAIPILLGFLVSVVVLVPAGVQVSPVGFALGAALTALLGVVFVSLAVGFSAGASSSLRAIVGTVGVYVYFFLFWNPFANSVGSLLRRFLDAGVASTLKLSLFLKLLNPTQSYQTLLDAALGQPSMAARAGMFGRFRAPFVCQEALGGNYTRAGCVAESGGVPFYFSDPAVLVYLLVWLVVPVVVGVYLFDRTDL